MRGLARSSAKGAALDGARMKADMNGEKTRTNWSLQVGQLAGTFVYVHVTFFVLLAWIGVAGGLATGSLAAAAEAVAFTTTLFACVVLHEFGHVFMARRFGIRTRDIVLFPFGGVSRLERMPEVPSQEFLIALAGPAVSVGIAAALGAVLQLQGSAPQLEEFASGDVSFAERLMFINAGLAVFNLLPAFPMDGGRVLRALLAVWLDYVRATELAARIGQGIAVLFALVGALMPNPMLLIIALFVWMGAAGEVGLAQLKRALCGMTVDTAMRTEFGKLAPADALGRAAEMAVRYAQSDFPVLQEGQVLGLLTGRDLARWLADGVPRSVGDIMHRRFETIGGSEPIEAAFERLQQDPNKTLLVIDQGQLVGLVGLPEIAHLLRVRPAVAEPRPDVMSVSPPPVRRTGTR
ncbi:MAG: site-2 protease family protein [Burkholderiales bacterium]